MTIFDGVDVVLEQVWRRIARKDLVLNQAWTLLGDSSSS